MLIPKEGKQANATFTWLVRTSCSPGFQQYTVATFLRKNHFSCTNNTTPGGPCPSMGGFHKLVMEMSNLVYAFIPPPPPPPPPPPHTHTHTHTHTQPSTSPVPHLLQLSGHYGNCKQMLTQWCKVMGVVNDLLHYYCTCSEV